MVRSKRYTRRIAAAWELRQVQTQAEATGDFNGDARADVAFFTNSASGIDIASFLSNGDGTFKEVYSTDSGSLATPPSSNSAEATGDFQRRREYGCRICHEFSFGY